MPKYDYECRKCGYQELDLVKPMASDYVPQHCEQDMHQIYQRHQAIKFNGPGFYSTGG
jgi:predicted nucleic acid-binding Zn ribbon protein